MLKYALTALILASLIQLTYAQQQYASLPEALQSGFRLRGKSGPASVNWIDNGDRYSFIAGEEIHTMDPKTGQESTVFTSSGLHLPGSSSAFSYESFQWSKDSRHLVFRTNFRRIFRNSGISDY